MRAALLFSFAFAASAAAGPLFEDATAALAHIHQENPFDDFQRQALLPNRLSQFGPGVAWCDLNGDGRDDLVIGGGAGGTLSVRLSASEGLFKKFESNAFNAPADLTGVAAWRDVDGMMRIFAGVSNFEDEDEKRTAVRGWELSREAGKIVSAAPGTVSATGPIAFADIDGDGDLDLFVGGRTVPGRYPEPASSRILRFENGAFAPDASNAAALANLGLISGAVFSDLNGDGAPDLVLAVEWGPVRVFMNDRKGILADRTAPLGFGKYAGWWNGVTTGDLDGDGRPDIIATNWGLNSKYRVEPGHSLKVYFGEFESQGRLDIVEAHYDAQIGGWVPERDFSASALAMPFLKVGIRSYQQFGRSKIEEIYGDKLKGGSSLQANTLEHMVFLNRGARFEARPLPVEAQFAPSFGVSVADLDGDGNEDLVMAQNFFAAQVETPRCDAGRSLVLLGDGKGGLRPMPGQDSGIMVYGDARGVAVGDFDGDRRPDVAIGQNGAATRLFRNAGARLGLRVVLRGPAGNPSGFGASVRLRFGKPLGPAREVHGGSGFWSQDSAALLMSGTAPTSVWVRWPGGRETTTPLPEGAKEITIGVDGGAL